LDLCRLRHLRPHIINAPLMFRVRSSSHLVALAPTVFGFERSKTRHCTDARSKSPFAGLSATTKRASEPRHFRVLHQARQDLPVPDMQAGIFIAQA
jgi:hypothetical protein